jgi:hypothetical protein
MNIEQASSNMEGGIERVPEEGIHPGSPSWIQSPECNEKVVNDAIDLRSLYSGTYAERIFGGFEIVSVFDAILRNELESQLGGVPMGINEAHTLAGLDVLANEIEEKGGLAGAGLTYYVKMPFTSRVR